MYSEGHRLRMNRKQRLIMNLIHAAHELEQAEDIVKDIGSIRNRMKAVEAYDRYREFEQQAIKQFSNIEDLEKCIAAGTLFMNIMNQL